MVVVSLQVFLLLILSSGIIRAQQEPEVVEVFEEGDAIPSPNEVRHDLIKIVKRLIDICLCDEQNRFPGALLVILMR